MRTAAGILSLALLAFGLSAYGQDHPDQSSTPPNNATSHSTTQKPARSAGGDIGSGSGDIGKGAGKGAGKLAEGTGKGVGDVVNSSPRSRCRSRRKRRSLSRQERSSRHSKRNRKNRQRYRQGIQEGLLAEAKNSVLLKGTGSPVPCEPLRNAASAAEVRFARRAPLALRYPPRLVPRTQYLVPPLDTSTTIEAGGKTKHSTTQTPRPSQLGRAKYRLSNTLQQQFFENKTFRTFHNRSPDLKYLLRILCAKQTGRGSTRIRHTSSAAAPSPRPPPHSHPPAKIAAHS